MSTSRRKPKAEKPETTRIRVWVECDSDFELDVTGEDWDSRSENDRDKYLASEILDCGRLRWGWEAA